MKLVIFFSMCFTISSLDSLKVTLYYESLCPSCRQFITKQLYPNYKLLAPYLELNFVPYGHARVSIAEGIFKHGLKTGDLVARAGMGVPTCDWSTLGDMSRLVSDAALRATSICELNLMTTLETVLSQTHIVDGKLNFTCQHGPKECYGNKGQACGINLAKTELDQLEFVICVESSKYRGKTKSLIECCDIANLKWEDVENCMLNGEGDRLLVEYGKETNKVHPVYVPWIALGDVDNHNLQEPARHQFLSTVCEFLHNAPKVCSKVLKRKQY